MCPHDRMQSGGPGGFDGSEQKPTKVTVNRADLLLLNANPNPQIIPSDQQEYYENYYLAHTPEGGIVAHTYNTITYKNIYPNIDMVWALPAEASAKAGVKYSFIVHPGGKVSDIQLQWNGLQNIKSLENGGISYAVALGNIKESAPVTFQDGKEISSSFIRTTNRISFKTGFYDKSRDLIIDPSLKWATYFGGSGTDQTFEVRADRSGNVFMTGYSVSSGIATSGAYQTSIAGGNDAFLAKFSNSGNLAWTTYYGGSADETARGLGIDGSGNVYITGGTFSSSGIATSGAYKTSSGGGYDAYLAKFNSSGGLTWSTYIGGSGYDDAISVCLDGSGSVFILGFTASTSGVASSGGYQSSYGGGSYDAFLAKFSSGGSLSWATYYGSSGDDKGGFGLSTDASGNAYISGETTSGSGLATSGAYQTSFSGGTGVVHAFLAKFSGSGGLRWATYYAGNNNDFPYGLCTDASGNVYISGNTYSSSGIASSGAYQTSLAGAEDIYLAKFSSGGGFSWSTYYGGSNYDYGRGVTTDGFGNVYITGYTVSTSGIATAGGYQTTYGGGGYDAYLATFSGSGNLAWASYYGGNGSDLGKGIARDNSGNVFITGWSTSTSNISTSGAYQTSYGGNTDAFIAKFNFYTVKNDDAGITTIMNPSSVICTGNQTVKVQLKNFGLKQLDSVRINWSVNNKLQTPYKWTTGGLKQDSSTLVAIGAYNFSSSGKDTIVAWTSKPNGQVDSVPTNDTAKLLLTVSAYPIPYAGKTKTICSGAGDTIGVTAISGHTYNWTSNPAGFNSVNSTNIVNPTSTTTYYLTETVTSGNCLAKDSVKISVNPTPTAVQGSPQTVCANTSVALGSSAVSGNSYSWVSYPSGFTSTTSNPVVKPTVTTIYILTETINATGCSKTDSVQITTNVAPVPAITGLNSLCAGTSATYQTKGYSGDTYKWSVSGGTITSGATSRICTISWPNAGTYMIKLIEYNPDGCTNSDSILVTVNANPVAKFTSNNVCLGDSMIFTDSSKNTDTWKWAFGDGDSSFFENPEHLYSKSGIFTVTQLVSTAAGCKSSTSSSVMVYSKPVSNFNFTQVCPGSGMPFTNNSLNASSYYWDFGDGTNSAVTNPTHIFPGKGSYKVILKATNANNCTDTFSKLIVISDCVWPGDADYNKMVNNFDLLPIGIAYGSKGLFRNNASTKWTPQPADDWSRSFKSGANYKMADCDGNGIIDSFDIKAIRKNYAKSHPKTSLSGSGNSSDPTLYLKVTKDSVTVKDTLIINISLGTKAKPVKNIYGICFTFSYNPVNVNTSKGIRADFSNCWMGTPGKDLVYLVQADSAKGVIDVGITRTDQKTVSGYGDLGTLNIIMPDNVAGKKEVKKEVPFDLLSVKSIDAGENDVPLYVLGDSVLFYQLKDGMQPVNLPENGIRLYPNPANTILHLKAEKNQIKDIRAVNAIGETVFIQREFHTTQTDIDVSTFKPGIYLIQIQTDSGIYTGRFVKL